MAKKKQGFNEDIRAHIKGVLLVALAVFCYVGLQFTDQTGTLGLFLNNILRIIAGETAIIIPIIIIMFAARSIIPEKVFSLKSRIIGLSIMLFLIIISFHLRYMFNLLDTPAMEDGFLKVSFSSGFQHEGGGLIGAFFSVILFYAFGKIATYIAIITLLIVSVLLIMNITLTQMYEIIKKIYLKIIETLKPVKDYIYKIIKTEKKQFDKKAEIKSELRKEENQDPFISPNNNVENNVTLSENTNLTGENKKPELPVKVKQFIPAEDEDDDDDTETDENSWDDLEEYKLPDIKLLSKVPELVDLNQGGLVKQRAKLLEDTLHSFGVKAKVVNYVTGPTVTRYEVQPEVGVKVSKILSLSDDIALNMTAPMVRIEAPIPGKAALGIEVPNKVVALVHFREVLESSAFINSPSPLTIALGKDITGVPVVTSLEKMPHLLIAGSTGSGKSVSLNVIICSMLYKATPDQVKFLMIDPKMVELNIYNNIPHLISPVITNPKNASLALKNMIKEMIRRYDVFAREGVRDLATYNERVARGQIDGELLPYIVVIIDELADLMLIAPSEVEDSIARLSQMARASGIHLLIATQRPSVDVLTGLIKANITSRIAFTVSSQVDSRTILDMAGAEKLLGRGDMLFYPVGMVKPLRVQSAFISNNDLKALTKFVKKQSNKISVKNDNVSVDVQEEEVPDDMDVLLPDAIELVVRSGQASISLLQRRFRIGYTRAARLIDDLEIKSIVGPHEGSKAREIIVTPEDAARMYEELKNKLT